MNLRQEHEASSRLIQLKVLAYCADVNILFAFMLCRGGGERGLSWQRQARVEGKEREVEDLQACLHHLFSSGISFPSLTALTACSAGAVPVGALCNKNPNLMRAVTLQVRCYTSMFLCFLCGSLYL